MIGIFNLIIGCEVVFQLGLIEVKNGKVEVKSFSGVWFNEENNMC